MAHAIQIISTTRVAPVTATILCRRDLSLRHAEGYLCLISACSGLWDPSPAVRDPLGRRALEALDELDEADQGRPYVLFLKGQTLRAIERYHEAVEPLQQAADLEPENIHVWLALGWCYKRLGRLDRAIESLEEALAADPNQAIIYYNLACYWSLSGATEVAVAYLANALEIDPSFRDLVATEQDFDPNRHHPSFLELDSVVV